MSEPDAGTTIFPPIGEFILGDQGLTAWRPAFDSIAIDALPDGRRNLRVTLDGEVVYRVTLEAAQSAHLAKLLSV